MAKRHPIGVFDSGYGGLTVLGEVVQALPGYDYLYLGDNARAPYGSRSFESVYRYTLGCVKWLFDQGCPLIVLACNTASAKALRTIQQKDLQHIAPDNRVLGVIRPTTEIIGNFTRSGKIGILATTGTVQSGSYRIEIEKFFPQVGVFQQACPMWVPLVENNEHLGPGADYFVREGIDKLMSQEEGIDIVLLACTHYPLMIDKIREFMPPGVQVMTQGNIVAISLADYLKRHPEIESRLTQNGDMHFYTTDSTEDFDAHASIFYGKPVQSSYLSLT
ncbi:MAG TPA: glutamate racemase [Puia sp.]|nr:glutamate racemase [Puia sp.]